jgi:hypothetical protein
MTKENQREHPSTTTTKQKQNGISTFVPSIAMIRISFPSFFATRPPLRILGPKKESKEKCVGHAKKHGKSNKKNPSSTLTK